MTKVGPTLVKSGLVYSMKNINTTTSFSLSPVSTKWYHPPSKHPHHYYTTTKRVVGASFLPVTPEEPWCQPDTSIYVPCTCVCVCEKAMHTHTQVLQCSKLHREQIFFFKSSIEWKLCPKMDFKMKTLHHPKKKNV